MLIDFHDAIGRHGFRVDNVLHVGAYTAAEVGFYKQYGAKHIHWVEANEAYAGDCVSGWIPS